MATTTQAARGVAIGARDAHEQRRAQPRRAGAQPRGGHRHPGVERERRARHRGRARRADHLSRASASADSRSRSAAVGRGRAPRPYRRPRAPLGRRLDADRDLRILPAGQYVVWEDEATPRRARSRVPEARSRRSSWTNGGVTSCDPRARAGRRPSAGGRRPLGMPRSRRTELTLDGCPGRWTPLERRTLTLMAAVVSRPARGRLRPPDRGGRAAPLPARQRGRVHGRARRDRLHARACATRSTPTTSRRSTTRRAS